jgi:hypothetical protein
MEYSKSNVMPACPGQLMAWWNMPSRRNVSRRTISGLAFTLYMKSKGIRVRASILTSLVYGGMPNLGPSLCHRGPLVYLHERMRQAKNRFMALVKLESSPTLTGARSFVRAVPK